MCIRAHGTHPAHRYIRRQQAVQLVGQQSGINHPVGIEVGHHQRSMHTGIGTPRPRYLYLAAQQGGQRTHQTFLHAYAIGLYLPAVVGSTIIRKINEISLHGFFF